MNSILTDILNYKGYLEGMGVETCLCLADDTLYARSGLPVGDFAHRSAYCVYVKSEPRCRRACAREQVAVRERMLDGVEVFSGHCHAGTYERVYRIGRERFVGFLSVTGLRGDTARTARRISRISSEYGYNATKLNTYMEDSITPASRMSESMLDTLTLPLVHMLDSLFESKAVTSLSDRVMSYVQAHYSERISMEDIARRERYSISRLSHIFTAEVGMSIGEYLKRVRMDEACRLLATTSMSISEVASRVGYADCDYFSRAFRLFLGKSPREYRKLHGNFI